jgi:propanol-preferring alcohol dehydrogenase
MKGWQFTGVDEPLTLVKKSDPVAGPDQVVIDVKAAGLCHSDVGFLEGTITWMLAKTPIILGHEVAGVITAVGPNVTEWKIGDRVGVAGLGLDAPGMTDDGGFGEKAVAPVAQLIRIPDGVGYAQAAAATDAGQTTRKALRRGGVEQGKKVGIVGLGGLGLSAARIAVLLGAEVYAAEPNEAVWPLALERGVNACVADVLELEQFGLDIIVDFAGFGTTTAGAIQAINPGGRVVQVGMGRTEATINTTTLVSKQIELVGSLGGSLEDAEDVFRLLGEGGLEFLVSPITFEQIPDGIETLRAGGAQGRLVALY